MNLPSDTTENPPSDAPNGDRGRARTLVVVAALLLVGGPLVFSFAKREAARWHHAAAYEMYVQGDLDQALTYLEKAIKWSPRDANLIGQRASWNLRPQTLEKALADCETVLALTRANYASRTDVASRALLANALNQHAYTSALADHELETALENIEQALRMSGDDMGMLDTRGYIHLKLGNLEEAQADLESAVDKIESRYTASAAQIRTRREYVTDQRPLDQDEANLDHALAVLVHHRGELYEALGEPDKAERDITRAEKLGFNPDEGVW